MNDTAACSWLQNLFYLVSLTVAGKCNSIPIAGGAVVKVKVAGAIAILANLVHTQPVWAILDSEIESRTKDLDHAINVMTTEASINNIEI